MNRASSTEKFDITHPALAESMSGDAEVDLVFRLAAREHAPKRAMRFTSIRDWGRLLEFASDENALIALRRCLQDGEAEVMPVDVERQLAILSLDREFRMRRLQGRVEDAIAAMNQARIEPLLLKGAALAYTLYGSIAARPMKDVDLLVAPERADEARDIMLEHGWTTDPELPGDESYDTHHHLPPLRDPAASGLRLEIHRGVLPLGHPFQFTDDEIWSAARRVHVGSGHALVMHPSHHAVHIAIHFAWAHMFNLGAWHAFRDLANLIARDVVDWDDFARIAERWGASTCCYWTLRLAWSLSNVAVPEVILRKLEPRIPELVRRRLSRHFARALTRSEAVCPSARLNRALWTLAMQPERCRHRGIRPWLVSLDLLTAFDEKTRLEGRGRHASALIQLLRSSRYLTELLA